MTGKRLYRSRQDRIFAGIFGGLGEYFDIDPVLLRVVWVVVLVVTGFIPGIIIYLIAIFVVPLEPHDDTNVHDAHVAEGASGVGRSTRDRRDDE